MGQAGPNISMRAPETTSVVPNRESLLWPPIIYSAAGIHVRMYTCTLVVYFWVLYHKVFGYMCPSIHVGYFVLSIIYYYVITFLYMCMGHIGLSEYALYNV